MSELAEFPKELAEHKLARLAEARKVLIEEHTASFRWIMASLLALNGGGLLALKDPGVHLQHKGWCAFIFWLGIVSALALAWRGQSLSRRFLRKLEELELTWTTTALYGVIDPKKAEVQEMALNEVKSWTANVFGWASLLFFSLGLLLLGLSTK